MTAPSRYWAELTTADFAALDPAKTVAVLPVAAIEQHGPHLPLSVDATINEGILAETVARAPQELSFLVLPQQSVGRSEEHLAFPGTLTLAPDTLTRAWSEIGRCVHRAGLRKLLLFNSHGGQPQVLDIVARDLRVSLGMVVAWCNWWRLGLPEDGLPDAEELTHGIHGGALETAIMLHLRPDLVRRDLVADFRSLSQDMAGDYELLSPLGQTAFAWMTHDLNPSGAVGDATQADAELGRRLVEHAADRLLLFLDELARFPLDRLTEQTRFKPAGAS